MLCLIFLGFDEKDIEVKLDLLFSHLVMSDCSMLGSSVLHCLPQFAQIHVGDIT